MRGKSIEGIILHKRVRSILMKTLNRKVMPFLLVVMILSSMISPGTINADTSVGGDFGTIPSGGTTGAGGGIINLGHPTFVVSFERETFSGDSEVPLNANTSVLLQKVYKQFNNHIPSSANSILFAPSCSYDNYADKAAITWYSLGNGTLNYIRGSKNAEYNYKLREIKPGSGSHIWCDLLYAAIPSGGDKSALAGKKWETIVDNSIKTEKENADKTAKALALWGWVLASDGKDVKSNLDKFLYADLDSRIPANLNRQACAWVDLMLSLWQLSPPGLQKEAYANEIERYLKGGKDIAEKPSLISVSTAVLVHAPKYNPQYLFIKSTDYIHYIARVVPEASLCMKNAGSRNGKDYTSTSTGGIREMIRLAADDSIKKAPNVERTTNLKGETAKKDAFRWGMTGVMSFGVTTYKSTRTAVTWNADVTGAMSVLKFNGAIYGFIISVPHGFHIIPDKLKGRFSIKTNPDETVILEPENSVVGQKVTVTLEMEQKGVDLTNWKNRLAQSFDSGYPQIKIDLRRTALTDRQADTVSPGETTTNPFLNTSSIWKGNNTWKTLSAAQLQLFMEGKEKVEYCDNTASYPIEGGSSVQFDYSAAVQIKLSEDPNDLVTLNPDPGTATKTFKRVVTPDTWISQPSYWSEIKNGSPGNETFEAMAGVPTTRNLYFASGGSEFIVEIATEYVPDTEITRTYRSYFTSVDSEFKAEDTAGNYTVPSPIGASSSSTTINVHAGGTVTATWTGVRKWTGSESHYDHGGSVTNTWDDSEYKTAESQALDWVKTVNNFTISHMSVSDNKTRQFKEWGTAIVTDQKVDGPAAWYNPGQPYIAPVPPSGNPPSGGSPGQPYIPSSGAKGGDGSFTIVVKGTVPAHKICGPQCCRVLPQVEDTWTQKIKFDHMKINIARVWKLDKAAVNGMRDITGTEEFKATVVAGDPNIFYNRSATNKSIDGRLRYTVETDQHDTVVWNEGSRSNKDDGVISQRQNVNPVAANGHQNSWAKGILYSNTGYTNEKDYHRNRGGVSTAPANIADGVDVTTTEWAKFNERRTTLNTATVISDLLILQTSSGDQSIIYFQKDSTPKQTQENFDKVAATEKEMMEDNPLTYKHIDPKEINIGSYNGKYYTPLSKYSVYKSAPVATKFDTMPAGIVRPARPTAAMRLMNTNLDIIDTIPNAFYPTGTSSVFYRNILNYGPGTPAYDIVYNTHYGATGVEFESPYSDSHTKVNDIVVHNPVSAEFSMVIPLENSRDQRTVSTQTIGGNLQGPTVESVKRLKDPLPKQNLIWNGDAEYIDSLGKISNWRTWESAPGKAMFTKRTTSPYKISGNSTFEIVTEPNNNYKGVYYTDIPGIPGDSYSFTCKLGAHRAEGYTYITALNSSGSVIGTYISAVAPPTGVVQNLSINFTAPAGTVNLRVHIVNGNTSGYVAGCSEYVFADDLVLYDNTTTTWQSMSYEINEYTSVPNPDYVTPYTIPNPDYIPANPGTNTTFNYTGNVQTFTAPATGTYTLELWGAQGSNGGGGYGGYSKGTINLTSGEMLYIYVGGSNGWNGGGYGHGRSSDVGGGGTDIRKGGQTFSHRIIVAGGGGGNGPAAGGAGGGTNGGTGGDRCGSPGGGGTQTSGGSGGSRSGGSGSFGQGGSNTSGSSSGGGGGGGGWYGGGGGGNDYSSWNDYDDSGGGGGSGYIGGVTGGTMSNGVRQGNGQVKITSSATPAVGSPTILVNNAHYIPAVIGAGGITTFNYTGAVRSYTVPRTGTYTLEAWGAQGGGSTGGKGGYSKGNVSLNAGDILYVYVGSTGDSGGWNGGGMGGAYNGGGASDIRKGGTSISNRVIVAGGGGGSDAHSYAGGAGGGTIGGSSGSQSGGSQSTGGYGSCGNGSLGQGGSSYRHGGGGGGGYYGGGGGYDCHQPGAGGSGYIVGVTGGIMTDGVRSGHGMIKITAPGITSPAVGEPWIEGLSPTIEVIQPVTHTITSAPDNWYENVLVTIPAAQPVTIPGNGTFVPGNFINLDYGFQIYFPNKGNFYGDNSFGISQVTDMRGKGFTNNMNTTEWTKEKYVSFEFNVIHNGVVYAAGQDIPLDINDADSIYDFYCPLANCEAISAEVTFKVIAINGGAVDNDYAANRERYGYFDARHSGVKRFNIDIVGRIGNLIMEDTGDFRFANLFKMPKSPLSWIIPNVVKDVDQRQQNRILGSRVDIRGINVSSDRNWLNTYGMLEFADRDPISFPLTPDKNNIAALRKQPRRVGYKSYMDIQTIGDYSNGSIQIIPYYYWLNLSNGALKQVDIYMDVNGEYKPINKFGAAVPGWDPDTIYNNIAMLNWDDESERRNYTAQERARTEAVASAYQVYDTSDNLIDMPTPLGKYHAYGNNQIMNLNGRNRTFIGTSLVNGVDTNPGNPLSEIFFGRQAQRWHFSTGLPSSAVAVEHGKAVTQVNIDALKSNNSVLLMALDIKAIGEIYVLQYSDPAVNSNVVVAGTSHNLSAVPYPIIEVISTTKSSADDLDTVGTH